jgi:hypothetical protein
MNDQAIADVSAWFRERGWELILSQESGEWTASLKPPRRKKGDFSRFASGDTAEVAALRARERAEQEVKAVDRLHRLGARFLALVWFAFSPLAAVLGASPTFSVLFAVFCVSAGVYYFFFHVRYQNWVVRRARSRRRRDDSSYRPSA